MKIPKEDIKAVKGEIIDEFKKVLTYFPCLETIFKNRKIEK